MVVDKKKKATLTPAQKRWVRLGPWYAMFPLDFAMKSIAAHTRVGQSVLDPFMGRGTTLAAAVALGRHASGMEINPIAWIYAITKTLPSPAQPLLDRLTELEALAKEQVVPDLPEFFSWAFHPQVLLFVLAAREHLDWRNCAVDRTLMALLLVDLHGKDETALSNQMRQTKSMSPEYAIRWWQAKELLPRPKNPAQMLRDKINWRYQHGLPQFRGIATAMNGDSTSDLNLLEQNSPFDFLLTSPPYLGVINYHYDQWLRRWLLGGPALPTNSGGKWQNRFHGAADYKALLNDTFSSAAQLLSPNAKVLVRTDAREATLDITLQVLNQVFPDKVLKTYRRPFSSQTQTHLFGDKTTKPGEVDLLLVSR